MTDLAPFIIDSSLPLVGLSKANQKKVMELRAAYQYAMTKPSQEQSITKPDHLASIFEPLLAGQSRERFMVQPINVQNKPCCAPVELSSGDVDSCHVSVRELMKAVLACDDATGFAVAHNHPSGGSNPSPADLAITKRMKQCAEIIGLDFIDHVIITRGGGFVSIRRQSPESFN